MKTREVKRVEAFEMQIWSRMETDKWTDSLKNEKILHRVGECRSIIKKQKQK